VLDPCFEPPRCRGLAPAANAALAELVALRAWAQPGSVPASSSGGARKPRVHGEPAAAPAQRTLRNPALGGEPRFLVGLDEIGVARIEAVPLALDFCHTRLAAGEGAEWVARRFRSACAALGTEVRAERGRLVVMPAGRPTGPADAA
jgi:hypothetical protein